MLVYCVTHRYYVTRPYDCKDHILGYYSTIEKARATVKDLLGDDAVCDQNFGFDVWSSAHNPNVEYLIDTIRVQ